MCVFVVAYMNDFTKILDVPITKIWCRHIQGYSHIIQRPGNEINEAFCKTDIICKMKNALTKIPAF